MIRTDDTNDFPSDSLRRRLEAAVAGPVAFDAGTRALYTSDASNYRRAPLGVVVPRSVDDVLAAVAVCREQDVPIVPRGGGTSIAGNACGGEGVVLDTSRFLTRILELDPEQGVARVEPGLILDDLAAAASPYGLTFGPDPSTHSRCTLGGMIGNNACGSHSVAWGTTADHVEALDVLRYDGTRMTVDAGAPAEVEQRLRALVDGSEALIRDRFPPMPRRVSGYNLDRLLPEHGVHVARALVGTEGTCVTVLGATVRLVRRPPARALLVLGFPDAPSAGDAAPGVAARGPLTCEGIDESLFAALASAGRPGRRDELPDGRAWLLVEVGGDEEREAVAAARALAASLSPRPPYRVVVDPAPQSAIWKIREEGAGLATRMADGSEAWPGWEDAAVPPERLGEYLRAFDQLMKRHGRRGIVYGHFGEGCVHVRIDFDLLSAGGVERFRGFVADAADLVVAHGGSLSGEHGDGQARAEFLTRMYGPEIVRLFEGFKAIWDPGNRMNPGMIVHPDPVDRHLRYGPGYEPRPLPTVFAYPHDHGSFAEASRRCVGVGKCRAQAGGVMCPSYRVTQDERHSTRGRARLLQEMLDGELIADGWRSEAVRDALDLCLACKGCKSDCPVSVDMATYKAEFLHHHYARRLRPAAHYSMGYLPVLARAAALAPGLVNRVLGTPRLAAVAKRAGGIAVERTLPRFAPEPLRRWFRRRGPARGGGEPVLLWPDTFTNYFAPRIGRAAVAVLEAAGFRVVLPSGRVCCGLTWVSTGQLGAARRAMRRTVAALRPAIEAGMPIVGLEPSCTAALRSDLPDLLPGGLSNRVAERTVTLAELLVQRGWSGAEVSASAITQVHCHQHAVLGFDAEEQVLRAAGVDNTTLDAGCCGLAGNFGFERGHYKVSQACAELGLLPAVRAADRETLVIADGFSCRTQIEQATGRTALHLAEVLERGLGLGAGEGWA